MVAFTKSTPRKAKKIKGDMYTVAAPFTAGHILSELEANSMNGLLGENIGNNTAAKLSEMREAGQSTTERQAYIDAYTAEYEFGAGRTGDPVEREMKVIATARIKTAGAKKGRTFTAVELKDTIELMFAHATHGPDLRKSAEKALKIRETVGDDDLSDLGV
jgi:hypothetical protein